MTHPKDGGAAKPDLVKEHIDRCIECYSGQCCDLPIESSMVEIMRGDLMIAVGMLSAMLAMLNERDWG